jgi:hypothetical protein
VSAALYQLFSDTGQLAAQAAVAGALLAFLRRKHRHTAQVVKLKEAVVDGLQPKPVVNWSHVADLERDIYGQAFHHDTEWGAPVGSRVGSCACDACSKARAATPKPVLERSPAVFPIANVTHIETATKMAYWADTIRRLRQQREIAWRQMKALCDDACTRPLVGFTPQERRAFDNLNAALDSYDQQIRILCEREERVHRAINEATATPGENAIYKAARKALPGVLYGSPSYLEVTAIGDREPKFIPADPQTQWQIDYDRGRTEAQAMIDRMERGEE